MLNNSFKTLKRTTFQRPSKSFGRAKFILDEISRPSAEAIPHDFALLLFTDCARAKCVLIGYFVQVAAMHKPPVDQKGFNNCRYGRIVSNWEPQSNCAKALYVDNCTTLKWSACTTTNLRFLHIGCQKKRVCVDKCVALLTSRHPPWQDTYCCVGNLDL